MDPIEQVLIRYGIAPHEARLLLALARMAQVIVYGEDPPPPVPNVGSSAAPELPPSEAGGQD